MTLRIGVPVWADVQAVLDNLSARNRAEYALLGWSDEERNAQVARAMARGDTKAMWIDDAPACVLSIIDDPVFGKVTWFLATDAWFSAFTPAMFRACRAFMAAAAAKHGPICSLALADDPQVVRWFEAHGSLFQADMHDGLKLFVYEPRNS